MEMIFLLIMAIVPGVAIALFVYYKDIEEPEPLPILLQAAFYGVLSFFIALGIGYLLHTYAKIDDENIAHQMIRAVIFVGFVEEAAKFLFLRGILFRSKSFTQPFDGIVYSVMIGMGFATAENILYVINGGAGTAIVRMFTAVPAHATFAIIMGFFIGEAKVFRSSANLYSIIALFFATLAHGYYDYFLFLPFIKGMWVQAIVSLAIVVIITQVAFHIRKDEIIVHDDD